MKNRRGYSLFELMIVATISSVLLGIALALLHVMLRSHGADRDHVRHLEVLHRLASQFRRDAHAARDCTPLPSAGPRGVSFALAAGSTATYEIGGGNISRTLRSAEKTVGQETFRLAPDTSATLDMEQGPPRMIALVIGGPQPSRALRIVALLAMDHRLDRADSPKESR